MITTGLRRARRWLKDTSIGEPLRAVGVVAVGKAIYQRRLLRRGQHCATILGIRLRFTVSSEAEIARIDSGGEEDLVARVIETLRPDDVVYDVGANIGMVSLVVAATAQRSGMPVVVHAFEPEPRNFDHLRRNANLNGLDSVSCHRLALAERTGSAQLFIEGEVGTGTHSILSSDARGRRSIPIDLSTAADFAREVGDPPTVVKIDVEGAEMSVIEGLDPFLANGSVRDLIVELHPAADATREPGASVETRLAAYGYRRVWSRRRGEEVHEHYRVA